MTVGHVYMKAVANVFPEIITVSVAGSSDFFSTDGGFCLPNELTATGHGTAQAIFSEPMYACIPDQNLHTYTNIKLTALLKKMQNILT